MILNSGDVARAESGAGGARLTLKATACVRFCAGRTRDAPVNPVVPEEEVGTAADDPIDGRAEGKLALWVEVETPTLRVTVQKVEPDGVATAAGALERDSPFVAVVADDAEGAWGDVFGLLRNTEVAVGRTASEAETAAEIFGDVF